MDWKRRVLVDGIRTLTAESWLREVWQRFSDRQIAQVLTNLGFRVSRSIVKDKRRRMNLRKAVSSHDRSETEDPAELDICIAPEEEEEQSKPPASVGPPPMDDMTVLRAIKNKPKTLRELSREFDRSEESIAEMLSKLRGQNFNIIQMNNRAVLDTKSPAPAHVALPETLADRVGMYIKLGIISDLHAASKAQQITAMRRFIQIAGDRGVRHFLVPGDLVAGINVYRGQVHDLYAAGARQQLAALDETLPQNDGAEYLVIGGNHDYSFIKSSGYNIAASFAGMRPDVTYFGFDMADVSLTDRVDVRFWHPSGGVPYAACLDQQTGILTKRGWIGWNRISMEDEIATLNPETHELEYQRPEEMFVYHYQGDMVHFKSRTVDHMVTPEHDIWARPYNEGKGTGEWRKISARDTTFHEDFKRQQWQLDMTAEWNGEERETFRVPFRSWSGARDLGDMPMDAFLRFLGWYISEGHTQGNGKLICITQVDPDESLRIAECMREIGLNVKIYLEPRKNTRPIHRIRGHNASLGRWLNKHAGKGAKNKRVPEFVKGLSRKQIGVFLDALFAGDGTKQEGRRWYQYGSISQQLRDDVQELLLKAGRAATLHQGKKQNCVGVLKQNMPTINTRPEIVDYDGIVWCVRVPNGLIYARRNGKPVWTGNSYRLQKGMEQMAFEELTNAIEAAGNPRMRLVLSGHLHISLSMMRGPILGLQCGCWEGQTNYLKRKALFPQIGGYIIELWLTDGGLIQAHREQFIDFLEIKDDYKNYPALMERVGMDPEAGRDQPLFEWHPSEEQIGDSGDENMETPAASGAGTVSGGTRSGRTG